MSKTFKSSRVNSGIDLFSLVAIYGNLIMVNRPDMISVQSINSDVVIACIDAFFPVVDKPTVIVVDRASMSS